MSEVKHGPLPWILGAHNHQYIYGANTKLVADTTCVTSTPEQDEANAAFIVEACNNYEAVVKERDELKSLLQEAYNALKYNQPAISKITLLKAIHKKLNP